jgi:phospholipase C
MANIVNITDRLTQSRRLRPRDFFEIAFVAQAGPISLHIDVIGLGPKIELPGFEIGPNGEEDRSKHLVQLEANIMIDVLDPITQVPVAAQSINNRGKPITNKNKNGTEAHGDLIFNVPKSGAGKEWKLRFTNKGSKGSMQCDAKVVFVKSQYIEETTLIPLRVLNNAFRQVVELLGLQIQVNNNLLRINVSPDLTELSGGKLRPRDYKFDLPLDETVKDLNLTPLEIRASTYGNAAMIKIFLQFETEGTEELDGTLLSANVTDAAITVTIELRNEKNVSGAVRMQPIVTVEVGLSGPIDLDLWIAKVKIGDLRDYANAARSIILEFINSGNYLDIVGRYVAEAFTNLSALDHVFNGLEGSGSNFLVRHYDPKVQSGDVGGVVGAQGPLIVADPSDTFVPKEDPQSLKNLEKIDHIIVLMQENRSFDQLLGYLKLQGRRSDLDGLTGLEKNSMTGVENVKVNPFDSSIFRYSPEHGHAPVVTQINDGEMSGFLASFVGRFPTVDPKLAMAFHTAKHVPAYDQLAKEYLICDRWFAAHPGPTQPNRYCTLTGQTPILDNYKAGDPHLGFLPETTIFDLLTAANITWAYYEGDIAFLRFFNKYRLDDKHVIPINDPKDGFFTKARHGSLEQVVFIDPNFADVPPISTASDDTPPADLLLGQINIGLISNNLIASPNWPKTLFVITYDEHGGFYDHVPPPGTKLAKDKIDFVRVNPQGSDFLGVRVPAFIISPWVPRGSVSSIVFDHTSIVKTILVKFFGENARDRMGRHTLRAKNLGALLTNPKVRTDRPSVQVVPKPSPRPGSGLPSQPLILPDEFHEAIKRFGIPRTLAK